MTVDVSKATGYAVLKNNRIELSLATGYVPVAPKIQDISKLAAFVVLVEGPPDPFDLEIRLSLATAYAVVAPGTNGPISYATSAAADILFQRDAGLRVTGRTLEIAHNSDDSLVRVTGRRTEALINATAGARIGTLSIEILRSTAEVTVQALITAEAVDIAYSNFGNARTTTTYVEVLMSAGVDGEDFGVVSVVN